MTYAGLCRQRLRPLGTAIHRHFRKVGLVLFVALACSSGWAGTKVPDVKGDLRLDQPRLSTPPPSFRPDRILIQPKPQAEARELAALHQRHKSQVMRRLRHQAAEVVRVPDGASIPQIVRSYRASGLVAYAEPDYILRAAWAPDDPRFADGTLWALQNSGADGGTAGADINALESWSTVRTADAVVVAVVDSGVRYTHQDLAENMWVNPGESGLDRRGRDKRSNGIDDDGNGFIDDVHGINAVDGTGDPMDFNGHGTHIAGTIGAVGDNGVGVVGVAWKTQIMALRFLGDDGDGSTSDAIACIDYARRHGSRIINASWGGEDFSFFLNRAIQKARDAGIIVVAASGNEGTDNDATPFYPAAYSLDNIVSVAATTRADRLASFSNFGAASVDIGAPGADIYSTFARSDRSYRYMDGTSMAAPHAAGALALLAGRFPQEDSGSLIHRLLQTADPLPALAGRCTSGGRINLRAALGPPVATLGLSRTGKVEFQGVIGDGSTVEPVTLTLNNSGDSSLEWTATSDVHWVAINPASGVLHPTESVQVAITCNSSAEGLNPGTSFGTIRFVNELTGEGNANLAVSLLLQRAARLTTDSAVWTLEDFQFRLRGSSGQSAVIEASNDLMKWAPVSTNTVGDAGWLIFRDPQAPEHRRRFYRVRPLSAPGQVQ